MRSTPCRGSGGRLQLDHHADPAAAEVEHLVERRVGDAATRAVVRDDEGPSGRRARRTRRSRRRSRSRARTRAACSRAAPRRRRGGRSRAQQALQERRRRCARRARRPPRAAPGRACASGRRPACRPPSPPRLRRRCPRRRARSAGVDAEERAPQSGSTRGRACRSTTSSCETIRADASRIPAASTTGLDLAAGGRRDDRDGHARGCEADRGSRISRRRCEPSAARRVVAVDPLLRSPPGRRRPSQRVYDLLIGVAGELLEVLRAR